MHVFLLVTVGVIFNVGLHGHNTRLILGGIKRPHLWHPWLKYHVYDTQTFHQLLSAFRGLSWVPRYNKPQEEECKALFLWQVGTWQHQQWQPLEVQVLDSVKIQHTHKIHFKSHVNFPYHPPPTHPPPYDATFVWPALWTGRQALPSLSCATVYVQEVAWPVTKLMLTDLSTYCATMTLMCLFTVFESCSQAAVYTTRCTQQ